MSETNDVTSCFKDFVEAQKEFKAPKKNRSAGTGSYKFEYADLGSIMEAVKGPLHKHGFAIMQEVKTYNDHICVCTNLVHTSGESLRSDYVSMKSPGTAQDTGKAITYLKRYSLAAFLGVVAEDDVDAEYEKEGPVENKDTDALKKAKEEMVKLFGERKITGREEMLDYVRDVLKAKEGDILSSADMMLDDVKQVIKTLKKDIETIKKTEA